MNDCITAHVRPQWYIAASVSAFNNCLSHTEPPQQKNAWLSNSKLMPDVRLALSYCCRKRQIDGRGWMKGRKQFCWLFSNLINLLLIEGYRNILHHSMFLRRNKWINFRSVFVHLCLPKLMRNDQESYAWHEAWDWEENSFRHNWDMNADIIVYIQKESIRRDSD